MSVRYYVIAADGQRYGPADVPTLSQWAQEGRLLPAQMVEEEDSGTRVAASSVSGINFPLAANQAPTGSPEQSQNFGGGQPYQQHYARAAYTGDDGSKDMTQAWVFGVLGLFCCGLIFGILGLQAANRAMTKGNPSANGARIFNIVVLCLWGLGLVVNIVLFATGNR